MKNKWELIVFLDVVLSHLLFLSSSHLFMRTPIILPTFFCNWLHQINSISSLVSGKQMKQVAAAIAALSKQQVRACVRTQLWYSVDARLSNLLQFVNLSNHWNDFESTLDMILQYYIMVYHNEIRWDNGINTYYLIFYFDVYFDICVGILYSITHEIRLDWIRLD